MGDFSFVDGLIVTAVGMIVVSALLATLWGLMAFVHYLSKEKIAPSTTVDKEMDRDEKRENIALLTAIVAAHEANPAKKYEVIEIKRMK